MRIAIVRANIGNFDNIKGIPKQNVDIDYFYYTENNLPFPLPNLNNRMKARYIKTQMHRFIPNYDMYIWLDGSIDIHTLGLAEGFSEQINGFDAVFYKHRERHSVYEEMEFIEREICKGNSYLTTRYGGQQMVKEALFYAHNKLPMDYPLYNTYIFARMNNERVNKCFDEWWRRCIEFSNFDQTMLSYVSWECNLNINSLVYDELRSHKTFTKEPHI